MSIPYRKLCPYCSKEVGSSYMALHKAKYCPMRPGRQDQIMIEAMGKSKQRGGTSTKTPSGNEAPTETPEVSPANNITKIDLTKEYDEMVKVMKPKDEEVDVGEEYQCGGCNTTFWAKVQPKRCPQCGVALQ